MIVIADFRSIQMCGDIGFEEWVFSFLVQPRTLILQQHVLERENPPKIPAHLLLHSALEFLDSKDGHFSGPVRDYCRANDCFRWWMHEKNFHTRTLNLKEAETNSAEEVKSRIKAKVSMPTSMSDYCGFRSAERKDKKVEKKGRGKISNDNVDTTWRQKLTTDDKKRIEEDSSDHMKLADISPLRMLLYASHQLICVSPDVYKNVFTILRHASEKDCIDSPVIKSRNPVAYQRAFAVDDKYRILPQDLLEIMEQKRKDAEDRLNKDELQKLIEQCTQLRDEARLESDEGERLEYLQGKDKEIMQLCERYHKLHEVPKQPKTAKPTPNSRARSRQSSKN